MSDEQNEQRPTIVVYYDFVEATWRLATIRGESRVKMPLQKDHPLTLKAALERARIMAREKIADVAIVLSSDQRVVYSFEEFTNTFLEDNSGEFEHTPLPCPWCAVEPVLLDRSFPRYRLGCTNKDCDIQPAQRTTWSGPHEATLMWNLRISAPIKPRKSSKPKWSNPVQTFSADQLACVLLYLNEKIEFGYSVDGQRFRMENGDILSGESLRRLGEIELVTESQLKEVLVGISPKKTKEGEESITVQDKQKDSPAD